MGKRASIASKSKPVSFRLDFTVISRRETVLRIVKTPPCFVKGPKRLEIKLALDVGDVRLAPILRGRGPAEALEPGREIEVVERVPGQHGVDVRARVVKVDDGVDLELHQGVQVLLEPEAEI